MEDRHSAVLYSSYGAHGVRLSAEPDDMPGILADAAARLAAGTMTLPVTRTYPLSDAAAAQRDSEAGHVRGKIVLVPR